MFTKFLYWWWQAELPKKKCEEIIDFINLNLKSLDSNNAVVNVDNNPENEEIDNTIRKTQVAFSSEEWLYNLILPYTNQANKSAGWNFEFHKTEPVQLTKYYTSNFYNTHQDGTGCHLSIDPKLNGVRKLSTVVSLSDDKNYQGGEFEITYLDSQGNKKQEIIELSQGSIIVFPSFLPHSVKPVTNGKRYSLVYWHVGNPFQ